MTDSDAMRDLVAEAEVVSDDAAADPEATPPTSAPQRSLARGISALFGAQVVTWAMSMAVTVVVPRLLGPEASGSLRLAASIWAVGLAVISLGTNTLVTLQVARKADQRTAELGPALVVRLISYAVVWAPLVAFVLVAGYSREVMVLFVILGATTFAGTLGELGRSALTGYEHFGAIARADVISKVVMAVVMIGAVVATKDVRVVAIAAGVPIVVSTVLLFRDLKATATIRYRASVSHAYDAAKRSAPYFLISVVLVLYMQIDVVLMSFFVSEVEIGWYGQADQLFGTLLFVPTILMSSLFPRQARAHEQNPGSGKELLEQGFRTFMMLAIPLGLGIVIVANKVSVLFYGDKFDGTGPVLAVYGVVLIFMFETILFAYHAISVNRQNMWCVVMIVAVVLTLPLDMVLIPWTEREFDNGAIGGALSYVVTEVMMVVVGIWKLAPELVSRRTAVRLLKCLTAGSALLLAGWPLRDQALPVTIAVGAIAYTAVLVATRPFDQAERDVFRRVTSKLPIGR